MASRTDGTEKVYRAGPHRKTKIPTGIMSSPLALAAFHNDGTGFVATRAPSTTTHAATFRKLARILKAGEPLLSRTQGLSAEHYVRALLQTRKLTDGKRAELGQSHALLLCRCQHGLYSSAQAIHGQIRQQAIYHTAHYMCVADS